MNENVTNEYEVTHPKWRQYEVQSYEIAVEFGSVYGTDFEFLNTMKPASVLLAEGSEITVESKNTIKEDAK